MSAIPQPSPNERLRYLVTLAGLPLKEEEVERLAAATEALVAGLRRLHELDLGEREPVLVYQPRRS